MEGEKSEAQNELKYAIYINLIFIWAKSDEILITVM